MLPHTPSSQYIYDLPDIPPLALVNMAYHQIPLSATLLVRRAPPTRPSGREPLYLFADSTTPAEQRHQEGAMWNFVTEFVQSDSATEQYIIGIQERYDSLIVMSNVKKSFGGLIGHHHILSLLVSHEKKTVESATRRLSMQTQATTAIESRASISKRVSCDTSQSPDDPIQNKRSSDSTLDAESIVTILRHHFADTFKYWNTSTLMIVPHKVSPLVDVCTKNNSKNIDSLGDFGQPIGTILSSLKGLGLKFRRPMPGNAACQNVQAMAADTASTLEGTTKAPNASTILSYCPAMAIIEGGTDQYSKLQEKLKTVKPLAEFRLECARGILEHCMTQKRGNLKFSKPEKLPASANENMQEESKFEGSEDVKPIPGHAASSQGPGTGATVRCGPFLLGQINQPESLRRNIEKVNECGSVKVKVVVDRKRSSNSNNSNRANKRQQQQQSVNVSRLGANDIALVQQFVGFLGRGTMKFDIRKDLAAVAATMVATFEVLEKEPDNMNYCGPKTEAYERASQLAI
ncbi:hypothetical protein LTR40_007377 [Exophiala xenobiotica]|nr:hypothetical protein LTR40_007377 [Exophiala xenobiotica]